MHKPRARLGFFLLFVVPGIPKDVLCYFGGIAPLRFVPFMFLSMAGRLPAIVGSTIMGDPAREGNRLCRLVSLSLPWRSWRRGCSIGKESPTRWRNGLTAAL